MKYPKSPNIETRGLVYFARMCDKIRLHMQNQLPEAYQPNLGRAMDLWTCQLLCVEYEQLSEKVRQGSSDDEVFDWAIGVGSEPSEPQLEWWNSYMRNRGFRDSLSEKLAIRIEESGFDEQKVLTFFDYIDTDEERCSSLS